MRRVGRQSEATVGLLVQAMEKIAPVWAAADWDNVGLLAGSPDWPVRRMLLAVDLTDAVLHEAVRGRFDAILSYHPPVFRPVQRMVVDRQTPAGLAAEALANRIAVYSPHTALDAAPGGTNDTLAALCGLEDVHPLGCVAAGGPRCKLVVFVPAAQVDRVADAVFQAGAGRIGDYERCGFRLSGEGTFFGTEATDPVVGKKGRLERVEEVRMETVFARRRLAQVVAALRRAHPYEEPAFDVYPLEAVPDRRFGLAREGRFAAAMTARKLARFLAQRTGAANVTVVGDGRRALRRAIVLVGAAGTAPFDLVSEPIGCGDVVVTGEIRHHDALAYARRGATAVALGHWASERPVLTPLAARLRELLPGVATVVSRTDKEPFEPLKR